MRSLNPLRRVAAVLLDVVERHLAEVDHRLGHPSFLLSALSEPPRHYTNRLTD
jgi:hypothetical protein